MRDNNVNALCLTMRDKIVTQYVQQCVETMRRSMFNNVTNYIQQCVARMRDNNATQYAQQCDSVCSTMRRVILNNAC